MKRHAIRFAVVAIAVLVAGATSALAQTGDQKEPDETSYVVISGTVTDSKSGEPVSGVHVNAWSEDETRPYDEERRSASVTTGTDGRYEFRIMPGRVFLNAWHEEFQHFETAFEATSDTVQDITLEPYPPKTAFVRGVVVDASTREPVPGVWVNVWRQYSAEPGECKGDVCTLEAEATGTAASRPYYPNDGGSVQTGRDGAFAINVYGGSDYGLSAWADGYRGMHDTFFVAEGENVERTVELKAIPPQTATVRGIVVDAETEKPVPGAYVSLENLEWGQYNGTATGEDGRFTMRIQPGYTLIWVRVDGHHYIAYADEAVATDELRSPMPVPRSDGPEYYTWVEKRVLADGEAADLRVALTPKPGHTATVQGWVIDEETKTGIPNAWVSIFNEDTGDWGSAETDKDGSYRIKARPGHHLIRASADGYYYAAEARAIEDGVNVVTIALTEGESGNGCCVVYAAERAVASDGAPAMDVDEEQSVAGAERLDAKSLATGDFRSSGDETYAGEPGGLGPYRANGETTTGTETPGFGVAVAAGASALMALAARRKRR